MPPPPCTIGSSTEILGIRGERLFGCKVPCAGHWPAGAKESAAQKKSKPCPNNHSISGCGRRLQSAGHLLAGRWGVPHGARSAAPAGLPHAGSQTPAACTPQKNTFTLQPLVTWVNPWRTAERIDLWFQESAPCMQKFKLQPVLAMVIFRRMAEGNDAWVQESGPLGAVRKLDRAVDCLRPAPHYCRILWRTARPLNHLDQY